MARNFVTSPNGILHGPHNDISHQVESSEREENAWVLGWGESTSRSLVTCNDGTQLEQQFSNRGTKGKIALAIIQEDTNYHHFHYYATFLFKTPLSTLQYASVNHTLYGKCVMLPQLN